VCLKTAIIINPDLTNTRNTLCRLLRYLRPTKLSEKEQQDLKDLFLILYKRNDVDHNDIFSNAKNVLFGEKNYKEILKEESKPPLLENINIKNLINRKDKYGEYAWSVLSKIIKYASSLVPGITDKFNNIDEAMRLGFNWT